MELRIRSDRIVTDHGILDGRIYIKDGKIAALSHHDVEVLPDAVEINAIGKVVLPGFIDTHTHIRYPGHAEREDFVTGSSAAAAGGITTLFEMPISTPGVRTAEILRDRMRAVRQFSLVDVALYAGGGHGAANEFQAMADAGAIGFKIFLHRPQTGREHEFEGLYTIDDGELLSDMKALYHTGRLVCFHAENDDILELVRKELEASNRTEYQAHADSHPVIAEVEAISRVILFAEQTGTPVSIVHVTTPYSAELIRNAKRRGVPVFAETCPQYLFFSNQQLLDLGPYAKINPPLRSEEERQGLWEFVADGTIDYIGTDHAPFTAEEKERGQKNIFLSPSGIPVFEAALPMLLTAVSEGRLDFNQLSRLIAGNQADIFKISDRKGTIAVGKDADLMIVDPDQEWILDHKSMKTKARDIALIYDGVAVRGKVETTIVRGTVVYSNGDIRVEPGHGEVVTPTPSLAVNSAAESKSAI